MKTDIPSPGISSNAHQGAVWPAVRLGDLIVKNDEWVEIDPATTYKELTVRLWGRGVLLRGEVLGSEIGSSRRIRVRAGQFILSKIDARNGALGLVPEELDGAVVTNDFPAFDTNPERLLPEFLGWISRSKAFVYSCRSASEGTTNRVRLKEDRFYGIKIPLPPLPEQRRLLAKIERVDTSIEAAREFRRSRAQQIEALLRSTFARLIRGASRQPMKAVAPLVRRPVEVRRGEKYPELGVRSYGKGTFHKPPLDLFTVGTKRLYRIESGDLLFSNVFAWEGAVAVAQPEDAGRVGSHRFITCVPAEGVVTADFIAFYFLTTEGLGALGAASPGGAGRNRTLALDKLAQIEVPIPSIKKQRWFGGILKRVRELRSLDAQIESALDALLRSVINRTFTGAL